MSKTSREYQIKAQQAVASELRNGIKRQLLTMATGTGKTFTAVEIIKPFNKRLWVTHEETLMEQSGIAMLAEYFPQVDARAMIEAYGGLTNYIRYMQANPLFSEMSENQIMKGVSVIKADLFGLNGDIVLASAQTLHNRLNKIQSDLFDVVVCDEAHLFGSKTFNKSLQHFDPKLLLGLTATPHRMDGMMMGDIFEKIVFQYNLGDAITDGYLCELDAIQVKTNLNLDGVHTLGGEFNQKELSQSVDIPQRNQLLVDSYKKYADGKQNLVFCIDVQHAQNVAELFTEAGYRTEVVVGDKEITPERKATIQRFKSGETQIVVNVMVLTAGFDYPAIGCVTMGCPTKSLTKYMQQLGRGTRTLPGVIDGIDDAMLRRQAIKASGKPHCTIIDMVDTTSRHRLINTFELDKKKPLKDRVFLTTEKREAIGAARAIQIQANKVVDTRVNLLEIPEVTFSTSVKMQDPATEKQLAWIASVGYDVVNINYTKMMATQIISGLPASQGQIWYLKKEGYDVSKPGITVGEYRLAKEQIEKRKLKAQEASDPLLDLLL